MKPEKQKTQVNFPEKKYKPMVLQVKRDSPSSVTVQHEADSNALKARVRITLYSSSKDIIPEDLLGLESAIWISTE